MPTEDEKAYHIKTDTVVDGTVTAKRFIGPIEGSVEEAMIAERDQQGQIIDSTYIKNIESTDGVSITVTRGDDTVASPVVLKSYESGTGLSTTITDAVNIFSVDYGSIADTACEGNDVRLSDARTPLPHDQPSSTITSLPGYAMAQTIQPISTNDTLNDALGKLEKGLSTKQPMLFASSPIVLEGSTVSHSTSGIAPGTYTKVTIDDKGHATAGAQITLADLQMTDADLHEVMQQQVPVSNSNEYNLLMSTGLGTDYTVGYVTKSAATSRWENGKGTIISANVFNGDIEANHISSAANNSPLHIDSDTVIGSVYEAKSITHYGNGQTIGNASFSGNITVGGDVTIDGGLYVAQSYIQHLEHVYVADAYLLLRDGATTSLATHSYSGLQIHLYDGINDGRLVIDNTGTARVGDVGDEQPLMTRAEVEDLASNAILKWDAANVKAVAVTPGVAGDPTHPGDVFTAAGFSFTVVSTD